MMESHRAASMITSMITSGTLNLEQVTHSSENSDVSTDTISHY